VRRRRVPALAAAATLAGAVVAGCGDSPAKPRDVSRTTGASGWTRVSLAKDGVSFERPNEWQYATGGAPLLATMTSGAATIAVWRYPRTETLPATPGELKAARDALLDAAKVRDSTFKPIKAKGTRAAHKPAVVIVAKETVAGQPRKVRSTHIYAYGGEVVVDAFAPPGMFGRLETPIFRRVVRSVQVSRPQA
jgi:hypothetical protein